MVEAAANTCAMLEVGRVADLKCQDVQDLIVPLEHMWPNTLNFWLGKFVRAVAKQNGERYMSICDRFIC